MEQRMVLYLVVLTTLYLLARYRELGLRWCRWQVAGDVLVLGVAVAGLFRATTACLVGALGLVALLHVVPAALQRVLERRLQAPARLADGAPLLTALRWLVPGPPGRLAVLGLRAAAAASLGRDADADARFAEALALDPPPAVLRHVLTDRIRLLVFGRRWAETLEAFAALGPAGPGEGGALARMWASRAVMEQGRPVEGLRMVAEALEQPHDAPLATLARLQLLVGAALAGDSPGVERCLAFLEPELRAQGPLLAPYWRGRCHAVRGEAAEASAAYEAARRENARLASPLWTTAIDERLAELGAAPPPALPADDPAYGAAAARVVEALGRLEEPAAFLQRSGPAPATRRLLWLLAAVWVAQELSGGSQDADRLVQQGAFVPALAGGVEPWRLASAVLLHAGALHLSCNLLGLHLFGRAVERRLGPFAYVGLFLLAGVLGNAAGLFPSRDMIGVGASGGVMGVLGATVVFTASGSWSGMEPARRRYLRDLGVMLLANLLIGHLEPQVFNAAHVGGFVAGALLAVPFRRPPPTPRPRPYAAALGVAGALLLAAGLGGALPGWLGGDERMPLVTRAVPGAGLTLDVPVGWQVRAEEGSLTAVGEDRTFVAAIAVREPMGQAEAVEVFRAVRESLRDLPDHHAPAGASAAPEALEESWEFELDGRRFRDTVRMVALGGGGVVLRFTAPLGRDDGRRALFARVVASLRTEDRT